jgi:hypothetical protein
MISMGKIFIKVIGGRADKSIILGSDAEKIQPLIISEVFLLPKIPLTIKLRNPSKRTKNTSKSQILGQYHQISVQFGSTHLFALLGFTGPIFYQE